MSAPPLPVNSGRTLWAMAEGYFPGQSTGEGCALESHEAVCILNAGPHEADLQLTLYFSDRGRACPTS